ncbi:MAG: gfo/Idh/MocA family oxidoreductase, partial [Clostridia bacterium]|nr:gfo/Idh/MocA family oxidoreductase [Clostridia bacterium]
MPSKIIGYAKVGVKRNINVENDVTAYFEYPNGASGVFITSTHDFPGTNRLEIDGDKGKLVIENNKLTFTELAVGETEFNATNEKFMPRIPVKKKHVVRISKLGQLAQFVFGQHTEIIRNFTAAIRDGKPMIAPGEDGING